jgi:hypothetical protein
MHRTTAPFVLALLMPAIVVGFAASSTVARAAIKFFVYNETIATDFVGIYLAPTGTQSWSANEAVNDPDKVFNRTERLLLTGITHNVYDVRLVDQNGHACVLRGIDLTQERTFEIKEGDLANCK